MEPASAMLIFVPLLMPVMNLLQINPTVAGIITVMAIRVGTVTPPYGLSTLMAAKIAQNVGGQDDAPHLPVCRCLRFDAAS